MTGVHCTVSQIKISMVLENEYTYQMPDATCMYTFQVEELREWKEGESKRGEGDESPVQEVDRLTVYRQILDILKPGETVLKVCSLHWSRTQQQQHSSTVPNTKDCLCSLFRL